MAAFEYRGVCCRCRTAEVVCPPVMDPDWTPEEQADVKAGWEETRVELEADTPSGEARRIAFIKALMENLMCKPCAAAQIQAALKEAVRQHEERADHPVVSDGLPACDVLGCKRQSCGYADVDLCNPDGSAIPLTSTIVLPDGRRQSAAEPTRLWICAQHSERAEQTGLQGIQVAFTVENAPPAAIILAEASRAREKNHAGDLLDPATEAEQVRVSGMWQANVFELTPAEMTALGKFNTVERLTEEEASRLRALRRGESQCVCACSGPSVGDGACGCVCHTEVPT